MTKSSDNEQLYALILAGGVGSRLWPKSRQARPKQLLDMVSGNTMLQDTCARIAPIISHERMFVVTNGMYAPLIRDQVPQMPAGNIVREPSGHGTAPCIGLSALYLRRLDPDSVMSSLHADHLIEDSAGFRQALLAAQELARKGFLVTLGIQPDSAHTGYGYIQRGEALGDAAGILAYRVRKFTEKPDQGTARRFVDSGEYYWNSGIFIWKTAAILEAIRKHLPELAGQLEEIEAGIGTDREREILERVWAGVKDESVDVGILEKADNVAVIPISVGWSDVGSWTTLLEVLPHDEHENVVVGAEHIGIDTTGSLLYGNKRLIATIDLHDMVVVDTEDVLLICPASRAQDVKHLIAELKKQKREQYL